ncbi:MAG: hypothetical protein ACI8R9_000568 [Paraglaciecola sp.]
MSTFILAFVLFVIVAIAMSLGYLLQRKAIAGSCGGLGALGINKACDCPEPCDRKKTREARESARQEKLAAWKQNQIL